MQNLKKYLILTILVIGLDLCVFGQAFNISGNILDNNSQTLPQCPVILKDKKGSILKTALTDASGAFILKDISPSSYDLVVVFIGFKELKKDIKVSIADIELGNLILESDAISLNEIKVKAKAPLAKERQDTTEFNASSAKVLKDATSEDLVSKMPSVTVENGQIKAQGEQVKQVLVDGKAFFGSDPTAALRNLPAEVVDKIQVFDQLSEQSRFSGVNDGNTTKTINIVTKSGMRQGQFGKVYAGYGYEDKYQSGGNINYFDGDRRLSIIGMSNNINIQNFSSEDLVGLTGNSDRGGFGGRGFGGGRGGPNWGGANQDFTVPSSGGIAQTHAIGLNYSDKWNKNTEVTGSYFFNLSDNDIIEETRQEYFNIPIEVFNSKNISQTKNTNHRLQARFEIKLDSLNSLVLRPRFNSQIRKDNTNLNASSMIDNIALNRSLSSNDFKNSTYNVNNTLMWRKKFLKIGRTFTSDWNIGYAPKKSSSDYFALNEISLTKDSVDQIANGNANTLNSSLSLEYTEPISKLSQILFSARSSFQEEESNKSTYDYFANDQDYTLLNSLLSSDYSNDYFTNSVGIGYSYNKEKSLNFNARLNFQHSELQNKSILPATDPIKKTYLNWMPSLFGFKTFSAQSNLRFGYRPYTQLPSMSQLQNILNNANPLQLSVGNPSLDQSFYHNIFARYQRSITERASTLFLMVGTTIAQDYIANATYQGGSNHEIVKKYNVAPGARISVPVNLSGNYSLRSFLSYAQPIIKLKTNLSFDLGYTFSRIPGILDSLSLFTLNHTISGGLGLSSNISDKIDYSISWRPNLNLAKSNSSQNSNNNFVNHALKAKLNWIIIEGFVIRTDYTLSLFDYANNNSDQTLNILNVGIGKKIFKNQRGEITLAINDLLNQNSNINRNAYENFVQDIVTNSIQRFVMLSFTYNLRNFNSGKKPSSAPPNTDMERMRRMH